MSGLPPETRRELRQALRRNGARWINRFYRRDLLLARTVRGMEIEAQQEYTREIVRPLLRQVGGRLANFDIRGNDVVVAAYPELVALENEIIATVRDGSDAVRRKSTERLDELTRQESEWVADRARSELDVEPLQPTLAQEQAAVDRPYLGAKTEQWFQSMLEGPVENKVKAWVQTGIQRGLTTDEIVRGLRGSRGQTGILEQPQHAVAALVRTAATHASTQARLESFEGIGVDRWRFVATLDHRTSEICAAHDGETFPLGEGPAPPLHPNCRSTAVPDFGEQIGTRASQDGQVDANTTYTQWFGKQSAAEQDQILGKKKAAAFRAGKLPFKKMVGTDLEPLTLEELGLLEKNSGTG